MMVFMEWDGMGWDGWDGLDGLVWEWLGGKEWKGYRAYLVFWQGMNTSISTQITYHHNRIHVTTSHVSDLSLSRSSDKQSQIRALSAALVPQTPPAKPHPCPEIHQQA